ncbi:cytochrome b5-related protein-like [Anopheles stephensi]|uniref:cytochrome b5-related protein-like n=1 Tax=Anopheles stephensi TaxID=30069 RepID=UPI0016587B3A|nr:cytochrome b5-related protein-like [Anopheles stephensi]XP_035909711.1 cytochrome b5-related protein-like [Anopheles stephensi]XP_035909712.1 cytochrome b5-related protein-like [Anopheles stephensi]XP_035909713.1 cytochrome b5-related protein-like [Anopheles stephensi]
MAEGSEGKSSNLSAGQASAAMSYATDITHRYPTFRDEPFKTVHNWLEGKRYDDGADSLWRINDGLYDLEEFARIHPGGAEWIQWTKGTDITEAFETHHIGQRAEQMLPKFYVRQATQPRNVRFTFHEHGFYRTLKRRIREQLGRVDPAPKEQSRRILDALIGAVLVTAYLAVRHESFAIGLICAICVNATIIAAHNFLHQRDNWRMYAFNIAFLSYREWRVSHVISHHLFPNSVLDMEISAFEPFLCYLPWADLKNSFQRYGSWFYGPFIYGSIFLSEYLKRLMDSVSQGKNRFRLDDLIPFFLPAFMYATNPDRIGVILQMWLFVVLIASFLFGLIGLSAGHHHPKALHSGDLFPHDIDFGLYQMATIVERKGVEGSLLKVLTTFGDHYLHHLFPTLDHAILPQLNGVFLATCDQFGVGKRHSSWFSQYIAQNLQLARVHAKQYQPQASHSKLPKSKTGRVYNDESASGKSL